MQVGFYVHIDMKRGDGKLSCCWSNTSRLSMFAVLEFSEKQMLPFYGSCFLQTYPSVQYDMQLVGCCEKHVALYQRTNVENLSAHFFNGCSSFGI